MDTAELQQTLNETIGHLVVHHGYTTYMRDYEVLVHVWNGPQNPPTYLRFHEMYGAELRPGSEATRRWSKAVGIDFHEVHMETNAHDLTLLFSDLEVSEVPVGHAPFIAD
ncbi:YxiG-like protein [Streptomyces chryseus]|uniref:YxiG-like protein n=1 Tax=Streptomyces chryseus TaxID=68186 RepID=UPI00110FB144|nr:hypothetical protein [Streptomyces chryseus]GGX31400.1 hypothetical protein GCM10010353_53050 [Streptomyces chryseus]